MVAILQPSAGTAVKNLHFNSCFSRLPSGFFVHLLQDLWKYGAYVLYSECPSFHTTNSVKVVAGHQITEIKKNPNNWYLTQHKAHTRTCRSRLSWLLQWSAPWAWLSPVSVLLTHHTPHHTLVYHTSMASRPRMPPHSHIYTQTTYKHHATSHIYWMGDGMTTNVPKNNSAITIPASSEYHIILYILWQYSSIIRHSLITLNIS